MKTILVLSLFAIACTTSAPTKTPPLDPSGTWSMSFVYTPNGNCDATTLPESWTVQKSRNTYSVTSVVFNGLAVDATTSGPSSCSTTDCSFALTVSWQLAAVNATFKQEGSWTLRADGSIDGYGTLTSVDNGNPSNTCSEQFTVTGTRKP